MITDIEYFKAKKTVKRFEEQEDKEFMVNHRAKLKQKDDEFQAKIDSGEIVPVVWTEKEKEFWRHF